MGNNNLFIDQSTTKLHLISAQTLTIISIIRYKILLAYFHTKIKIAIINIIIMQEKVDSIIW
ncbi:uncharacterized protein DS421_20g695800 [Arachis hypogaea]|nr:uncharacterized protein DS421_20g695800 [Arachis hypogaea]